MADENRKRIKKQRAIQKRPFDKTFVAEVLASPVAAKAQKLFDIACGRNGQKKRTLTIGEARQVQNLMLFRVTIATANRPSAIARAEKYYLTNGCGEEGNDDDNGSFVLFVEEHKTASSRGAAPLNMPQNVRNDLKLFYDLVRPSILSSDSPRAHQRIFTKVNGPHDERSLGATFSNFCNRCVGRKATFRDIRFTAVTCSYQKPGITRYDVASLAKSMSHSENTAKKYYDLTIRNKGTRRSRFLLDSVFDPTTS